VCPSRRFFVVLDIPPIKNHLITGLILEKMAQRQVVFLGVSIGFGLIGLWMSQQSPSNTITIQTYDCSAPSTHQSLPSDVSHPIVLRSCVNLELIPSLLKWPQIWPQYNVRPQTIKVQSKSDKETYGGYLYFDKSRPWSDYYADLQYSSINRTLSLGEYFSYFFMDVDASYADDKKVSNGKKTSMTNHNYGSTEYGSWRLPQGMRNSFKPFFEPVLTILPHDLSSELKKFDEQQSWNLWLASPRARASPHYDIDNNVIIQLSGKKRMLLSPLSSILTSTSIAPLHPSTHPNWRHLQQTSSNNNKNNNVNSKTINKESGKYDDLIDKFGVESGELLGTPHGFVDLEPGDVLFIPPFYFHATENSNDKSTCSINTWFGDQSSQFSIEDGLRGIPLPVRVRNPTLQSMIDIVSVLVHFEHYSKHKSSSSPLMKKACSVNGNHNINNHHLFGRDEVSVTSILNEVKRRYSEKGVCKSVIQSSHGSRDSDDDDDDRGGGDFVFSFIQYDQLSLPLKNMLASVQEILSGDTTCFYILIICVCCHTHTQI
jgi:hypothetical protein